MNMAGSNITSEISISRRVRALFGVTADVVLATWKMLVEKGINPNSRIKHLLYMMAYFKNYSAYELYLNQYKCTEKTLSTWV
jgi:hypothetical protein